MKVSFFPGCSLEGTAREYGESVEAVCNSLEVELQELSGWNCCGASSAHSTNEYLSVALPARNLALAEKTGQDLIIPCAACYSRLKTAEKVLTGEATVDVGIPFQGQFSIKHMLDFFAMDTFTGAIEKQIKKPLKGLRAVSYYGCLIVRPPHTTDAEYWEDPQSLDMIIARLGGESVFWPYKTECCGGSLVLTNIDIIHRLTGRLLDMAKEAEADCIVTACPLCQSNLDTRQEEIGSKKGIHYNLPVFYFTELMGLAFGAKETASWLHRHFIDPVPLLQTKKLL